MQLCVQVKTGNRPVCGVPRLNTSCSPWTLPSSWPNAWWTMTPGCQGAPPSLAPSLPLPSPPLCHTCALWTRVRLFGQRVPFVPQVQGVRRAAAAARHDFGPEDPERGGPGPKRPTAQHGLRPLHSNREGTLAPFQKGAAFVSGQTLLTGFRPVVRECGVCRDDVRTVKGGASKEELNVPFFGRMSCFRVHHWLRADCRRCL